MPVHRYSLQKYQSKEIKHPDFFFLNLQDVKLHVSILMISACTAERMTLHF